MDKRQLPRWQVKREARLGLSPTKGLGLCIIEDLNLKGMKVSFSQRFVPQQELRILLALEDGEPMDIQVHVPWSRQEQGRYVYGMFFNKIMDQDKEILEEYINTHCSQQFKDKWWA